MAEGKSILWTMGMVLLLCAGRLAGGESAVGEFASLTSVRKNAAVGIGGEFRVDYTFRNAGTAIRSPEIRSEIGDFAIRNASLRIHADVHPNVRAMFKMNLSHDPDPFRDEEELLEEALLVMHSVAGTGLGFFAGKGRAPYGQDITLGILQSYHHSVNQVDSSEGRIFIVDPPADAYPDPAGPLAAVPLPPMRPGQFDRAFLAGASYQWGARWKVEAAIFQPNRDEYRFRLNQSATGGRYATSDLGFAGRLWWSPVEDVVLEVSGMVAHSREMGRADRRFDLPAAAGARKNAYAVSAGFDWRPGPWRVFGEYQHAWDWNFSKGYDTDTWQLGMAREIAGSWRVGAMGESLRIRNAPGRDAADAYYKLTLTVRYDFAPGLYVLAEYGHEWFRRKFAGGLADKRRGDFLGVRVGLLF